MTQRFPVPQFTLPAKLTQLAVSGLVSLVTLTISINPSLAGDPFRTTNPRIIGDKTEAAFKAIFERGNYTEAQRILQEAVKSEPNEPLAYAMLASLSYTNGDDASVTTYSKQTLSAANKIIATDPLRGNLYTAVGHFLEGAATLKRQGTVNGAPQALATLRQVYDFLDKAEAISPNDPELNLLKGYMDLLLAVNLPFANPEQAIQKLEKNAGPKYLVQRGIAIAYRDLQQYDRALNYVSGSLSATPDNPETYYLMAQIQRSKAKKTKNNTLMKEAIANFDLALAKKSQLPAGLVRQIERERRNAAKSLPK